MNVWQTSPPPYSNFLKTPGSTSLVVFDSRAPVAHGWPRSPSRFHPTRTGYRVWYCSNNGLCRSTCESHPPQTIRVASHGSVALGKCRAEFKLQQPTAEKWSPRLSDRFLVVYQPYPLNVPADRQINQKHSTQFFNTSST